MNFRTREKLGNFDGDMYWTLVQCVQSRCGSRLLPLLSLNISIRRMVRSHLSLPNCSADWSRVRSGFRVEQCEIEAHAPVGAVAWGIGVIFSADLEADRLLSDLSHRYEIRDDVLL